MASICSVILMLPISEAILEPIFLARMSATMVEQNSRARLSLAIYPTYILGIKGLSRLFAVCRTITAPRKTEIRQTIGIESIISLEASATYCFQKILHLSGFSNTLVIKIQYCPINSRLCLILLKFFCKLSKIYILIYNLK